MEFLKELSTLGPVKVDESRLFTSLVWAKRYNIRQLADILFLYFVTLEILRKEENFDTIAEEYYRKTASLNGFTTFRHGYTDLYVLLHIFLDPEQKVISTLKQPRMTDHLLPQINLDANRILLYLRRTSRGNMPYGETNRFMLELQRNLMIVNADYKATRRLAVDWVRIPKNSKRLCVTRLLQAWRHLAFRAEIYPMLESLAEAQNLEMVRVCNPETGECPPGMSSNQQSQATDKAKSDKYAFLKRLAKNAAAFGAGYAGGRMLGKHLSQNMREDIEYESLSETASAGATSAGAVAAVPSAFGVVHRRPPFIYTNDVENEDKFNETTSAGAIAGGVMDDYAQAQAQLMYGKNKPKSRKKGDKR